MVKIVHKWRKTKKFQLLHKTGIKPSLTLKLGQMLILWLSGALLLEKKTICDKQWNNLARQKKSLRVQTWTIKIDFNRGQ